jgi:hypothetical protein
LWNGAARQSEFNQALEVKHHGHPEGLDLERLFLVLPAETGIRVLGVPVEIMAVIVPLIFTLMLLLQTKQIDPGDDLGGVDDVETIGNETTIPGLLHHLIEPRLETLRPQALPEAAEDGVIGRQLLGAQPQEPLADQVKGGLFLHLAIRQIIEKLQKHHLEHQHRVPGVSAPIDLEVFAVLLDKPKIHHWGQVFQKVGSLG